MISLPALQSKTYNIFLRKYSLCAHNTHANI